MSEFKVTYVNQDGAICSAYINATSKQEARDLVFSHTSGCVQTLSAEYTA